MMAALPCSALLLRAGPPRPEARGICRVTGSPLENRLSCHPIVIQGHGCDLNGRSAAILLKACPEWYLRADGAPRNQPAPDPCP